MSTFFLTLTESAFEKMRVGNSMSTQAEWDGRKMFRVYWKNDAKVFEFAPTDKIRIACNGEFPEVCAVKIPSRPLERLAWEHKFFKGKRQPTLDALREKCKGETYYSRPHGCSLDACSVYVAPSENVAVAYRAAMEGQVGVPFAWFANEQADVKELAALLDVALGDDASFIYSSGIRAA